MMVVIQCAASKHPNAGFMRTAAGKQAIFVADPLQAPPYRNTLYARPDDPAQGSRTWRDLLVEYNATNTGNPYGLLEAYELYRNPVYSELVEKFGLHSTFILSAGWGLISADFLTPQYDITFSSAAASYKRRRKSDRYQDFCMLPTQSAADLYFLGGKDYVPLFAKTASEHGGKKIVFYNSATPPHAPGCELRRFETSTRTNWHYECARAMISGEQEQLLATTTTNTPPARKSNLSRFLESRLTIKRAGETVKPSIETVWARLQKLQGQYFETKTGKAFTFEISGRVLKTNRTNFNLPQSEFAKALNHVPIEGPGEINNLVRGPSYIWAILHDPRVRRGEW
ncbi:hypothetical protein [Elongatibacter sediminis]|uniref:Uncharacterized protein n=1 Tax=Elongatibacter sediminis TaxID=3119006 RepID=A0AAW9RIF6_9GAMM